MGLETVRGQHSFNTFSVQSNRFIDLTHLHLNELSLIRDMWLNKITSLLTYLTINSHTNPFNLASSGLLRVWAPGSKRSWTSS